jgi:predicted house-cleaning NTP pyrophosphatase (Maf/HAM1 superfamily)
MRRHARDCWGKEVVDRADNMEDADAARQLMEGATQTSITSAFLRVPSTKKTYSTRQHTTVQVRLVADY